MLAMVVLSALTALPPTGTYTVTHDSADVRFPVWEGLCGDKPAADTLDKRAVVRLKHYEQGTKFWIDGGQKLRVGSDLCMGDNPSLKVAGTPRSGPTVWEVKCDSARVVQWTETSTHTITVEGDVITVKQVQDKSRRIRRSRCKVRTERTVILRRDADLGATRSPDELKVGEVVKPKVTKAPPTYDAASIEKELERELLEETRLQKGAAKIIHQNRLDKEFYPVSATYLIDGKPLRDKQDKALPTVDPQTQLVILDDVLTTGVHSLEVKLVYKVASAGRIYRVELSDATFFDVTEDKPVRLLINTVEKGGLLTEKTESGRIEFYMNGKKLES